MRLPGQVAVSPDGYYIFSANQVTNTITIVDALTLKVLKTLHVGRWAHGLGFAVNGRSLLITNEEDSTVTVVDLHDLEVTKTIKTGLGPNGIAAAYPLILTPHW